jgi:hypothetical protein
MRVVDREKKDRMHLLRRRVGAAKLDVSVSLYLLFLLGSGALALCHLAFPCTERIAKTPLQPPAFHPRARYTEHAANSTQHTAHRTQQTHTHTNNYVCGMRMRGCTELS